MKPAPVKYLLRGFGLGALAWYLILTKAEVTGDVRRHFDFLLAIAAVALVFSCLF